MMLARVVFRIGLLIAALSCSVLAEQPYIRTFGANDTFIDPRDDNAATQKALTGLTWKAGKFEVTCEAASEATADKRDPMLAEYDALVRFPSPFPNGDKLNDTVVMEWFAARDKDGKPVKAPAMVVLHILDSRMTVARIFARAFAKEGIHAFVMQMPHYGRRRAPGLKPDAKMLVEGVRQAVADARRARDAIAALPNIEAARIGIQGTSLGGFICTAAGSLDDCFNPVLPTLAGADLPELFKNGKNEVAKIREQARKMGLTDETFTAMIQQVDPLLLCHRMNPKKTFLYNAEHDEVIPAANAKALANAAKSPSEQHVWMIGGHVSCIVHLPEVIPMMVERIKKAE